MDNYPMGANGSDPYFDQPDAAEVIDPAHDAEVVRRMALAQALYKAVSAEVKTGDEFNLRGEFDAIMRERFAEARKLGLSPKSFDVNIDGKKVGTYSIAVTEPKPEATETRLRMEDADKLLAWALERGFVNVDMAKVTGWFAETGEVPDGCAPYERTTPAVEGGAIARTTLRVDVSKVTDAIEMELGEMVSGLLEGVK